MKHFLLIWLLMLMNISDGLWYSAPPGRLYFVLSECKDNRDAVNGSTILSKYMRAECQEVI